MQIKKLKEIAKITMGQSPKSKTYNDEEDGIPFFQGKADFGDIYPSVRVYCNKPLKIANKNDILISIRAPVGDVNVSNVACCIGRGLASISPETKILNYKYLFYILRYKKDKIADKGTGSTFKAINKATIENIEIPLPDIQTQRKIVEVLDKAQSLIDKRKEQINECDNLIQSLFYDMFGDPVYNSKEFNVTSLGKLIKNIRYGTSTPPEFSKSGYKFIRATNIKEGYIVENDMKYISEEEAEKISKCLLKRNELIIVRSGVNAGDTAIVTNDYAGHYAGYDIIIVLNEKILNVMYLNAMLNTTNYKSYIIKPLTRRAAQPHINAAQVKSLPIILPNIELQETFKRIAYKVIEQKTMISKSLSLLEDNFNALMQKAFKGELFA